MPPCRILDGPCRGNLRRRSPCLHTHVVYSVSGLPPVLAFSRSCDLREDSLRDNPSHRTPTTAIITASIAKLFTKPPEGFMFPSWGARVKFPNWPGPVKLLGVTEVGRRDAWRNRNELIVAKAVVIVARTTPTKVAKYAYLICRSILVNNLHLAARLVFKEIEACFNIQPQLCPNQIKNDGETPGSQEKPRQSEEARHDQVYE